MCRVHEFSQSVSELISVPPIGNAMRQNCLGGGGKSRFDVVVAYISCFNGLRPTQPNFAVAVPRSAPTDLNRVF